MRPADLVSPALPARRTLGRAGIGLALAICMLMFLPLAGRAADEGNDSTTKEHAQDDAAIRAATKQYIEALERGDAKAMESMWVSDGDIVDASGKSFPARELIASEAKEVREGPRAEIKVAGTRIRFLTDDVAVEDGTTEVSHASAPGTAAHGRFTVLWVKREGKWHLASLREARIDARARGPQLAELDWMVGDWSGEHGDATIDMSVRWNANHTFLLREMRILRDGKVVHTASQRIGWEPGSREIKSWVFDSDGGHGEGVWVKHGDTWISQATGVLPDGRHSVSTNIYTRDGADGFTWKSTGSMVDGVPSGDLDFALTRKPAAKSEK